MPRSRSRFRFLPTSAPADAAPGRALPRSATSASNCSPRARCTGRASAPLFVADVHLGKAAAFRAGGVPLPRGSTAADLARLAAVLQETGAQRLVVLGDFLHGAAGRVAALDTAFRALAIPARGHRHGPGPRQPRRSRRRPAGGLEHHGRRRAASAGAFPGVPRPGVPALRVRAVRPRASRRYAARRRGPIGAPALLRARPPPRHPAGVRRVHRSCPGGRRSPAIVSWPIAGTRLFALPPV